SQGRVHIRQARYARDARPVDESCGCPACRRYSRGYLRHLFIAGELLGLRLLSLHNVRYLVRLADAMRGAIRRGNDAFAAWAAEWRRRYTQPRNA
ncbi:MAG: tRNA-guanine transglycosylase, partial [Myxococcota bacterium]